MWSLVSGRLTRWYITTPIALILLGMAAGWETAEPLIESLTSTGVERTVEVVLSLCLVLACILVPSDLAPASSLVKDRRIPARVRNLLNVGSGYNDAIVAPVFLTVLVIQSGPEWDVALVVLIALTLGRAIPVFLATTPSRLTWPERATVAWLGPRGIASIVFALLVIQEGDEGQVEIIIQAVVMVVFLSVMLHGLTAPLIGRAFEKRRTPALDPTPV